MLAHPVDVGDHHPVVGIDEHFHEPLVDGIGMELAQEHEVAEDHEPFDMVAVPGAERGADGVIDRFDASRAVIERSGHRARMGPVIASSLGHTQRAIDQADVLAPADDLPNESFERIDGDIFGLLESRCNDLVWGDQSDVEHRGEDRVVNEPMLSADCVFVVAEPFEPFLDELS